MNVKEFDNYNRSIAYHIEMYKRGKCTKEQLYTAMKAHIGKDAFKAAQEIIDEEITE